MIETTLYSALSTSEAITGILGTRVYPLVLPNEPVLPAIDYKFVSGSSKPTFNTRGISTYRIEINCWGRSYVEAYTLRNAVKDTLSGYSDGVTGIQFLSQQDLFDEEILQYRAICEFYMISSL